MLLKVLVLVGLAIYFWPEVGLSFLALSALAPSIGLIPAGILVIILVVKSWYGSAAILAGLIVFNLVGSALLQKQSALPPNDPEQSE